MPRADPMVSAGLMLFRWVGGEIEVLIAHPGGPLWAKRDEGAWSIPKGLVEPGESTEDAARREFTEETGHRIDGDLIDLGTIRQRAGKVVHAFAAVGDLDPESVSSTTFSMEWPPRSGRRIDVPEIDRVTWADVETASRLLNPAQVELVHRLIEELAADDGSPHGGNPTVR